MLVTHWCHYINCSCTLAALIRLKCLWQEGHSEETQSFHLISPLQCGRPVPGSLNKDHCNLMCREDFQSLVESYWPSGLSAKRPGVFHLLSSTPLVLPVKRFWWPSMIFQQPGVKHQHPRPLEEHFWQHEDAWLWPSCLLSLWDDISNNVETCLLLNLFWR